MQYTLLQNVLPQWAWWLISIAAVVIVLACIWTAIIFFVKSAFDDFNNRRKIIGGVFLLIATGVGGTVIMMANDQSAKNISNVSVVTESLKAKYALKDVEWFATETTARPQSINADGSLVVVDNKDQRIVFNYKVNMETGEPYLINLPLNGGYSSGITAESLENSNR